MDSGTLITGFIVGFICGAIFVIKLFVMKK